MIDGKPRALDLFSGCGGLTEGLKQAGFQVLGAVDNDSLCAETYRANHPEVYVWEIDIKLLRLSSVKKKLQLRKGELDLLAGCPPCQGFSTLRTLNGARIIEDSRNALIKEFYRFVKDLNPKVVMLENVPGIVKDERFTSFYRNMKKLGYRSKHKILNAANYGVPQRRRRLIYIAGRSMSIDFAAPCNEHKTVYLAIRNLPKAGKSGDFIHDFPEQRSEKVSKLIKQIPKNGGSRTDLPENYQLECHKRCDGFKDIYGRMSWDKVAPTITSGCFNPSKGRFLHPEEDRAITMREASILQGFPINYIFPVRSKTAIASIIGNAIPPPFIAAHAHQIIKQLQGKFCDHSKQICHRS